MKFKLNLFLFVMVCIFATAGCVRQQGPSSAVSVNDLAGSYHVLWSDGEPNDHIFKVEYKNNGWWLADDEEAVPLLLMTPVEIEEVFGKEVATKAHCLETSGGASTIILCIAEPGVKTKVRIDDFVSYSRDFTSKTGHFVFIDYMGIWDLEKLK